MILIYHVNNQSNYFFLHVLLNIKIIRSILPRKFIHIQILYIFLKNNFVNSHSNMEIIVHLTLDTCSCLPKARSKALCLSHPGGIIRYVGYNTKDRSSS